MLETCLRFLCRLFSWIAMAAMAAMALHVTADVVSKNLLNLPLPVTVEMTAHYYMVAVVFFPIAAVELRNGHISVEIISQYVSERGRQLLVAAVSLVGAAYFAIVTARTWGDAVRSFNTGEYLYGSFQLTVWPTRFFIPLGCGLLAAVLVWKAVMLISGRGGLLSEGDASMKLD